MPGEEICTIINRHVKSCGQPPQFDFGEFAYTSYFENSHGDQSLFLYDSEEVEVIVFLADAGWDHPQVLDGQWILENRLPSQGVDVELFPNRQEEMWLKACKSAVKPRIKQDLDH